MNATGSVTSANAIRISLLGGFRITTGAGIDLTPTSRKARCLVAYLALADGLTAREKLAGLLWSRHAESQARTSLRQCLKHLRRCFRAADPHLLCSDYRSVALCPERVLVDAYELYRHACLRDPDTRRRVLALWRGEPLHDLELGEPVYDAWVHGTRSRLQARLLGLLEQALQAALAEGRDAEALAIARDVLRVDACHETAHRELMRLLAAAGDRGTALRQYQLLRENLARELDAEPAPTTRALFETIRAAPLSPLDKAMLLARPDAVAHPCPTGAARPRWTTRPLLPSKQITAVFDLLNGALLILGKPGVGKTAVLTHLAGELRQRAKRERSGPLPLVLHLSTWARQHLPLADWLALELADRDDHTTHPERCLAGERALLLDGFDTLEPASRIDCVQAINAFRSVHFLTPVVVCSRRDEYHALPLRLRLTGAVEVLPAGGLIHASANLATFRTRPVLADTSVERTVSGPPRAARIQSG